MQTIVFLVAHASDLESGAGGTCALLAARGYDIRVVVMADDPDRELDGVCRREALTGAGMLGVRASHVHFLGRRTGDVRSDSETVSALRALADGLGVAPVAVFTHSEASSHRDHAEASRLARAAFRQTAIFKFQVSHSAVVSAFAPSIHCLIDRQMEQKERALRAHATQFAAGRNPIDHVRAFATRYATGLDGRFCEAFELDIQNDSRDIGTLIAALDGSPFSRFWSPLMAASKLHVLLDSDSARTGGARPASLPMSDAVFATRLQGRLLSSARTRLGEPATARFEAHQANRATDEQCARTGHVLVLGNPFTNPAADAMLDWMGLRPYLRDLHFSRRRGQSRGLLTLAANPLAASNGVRAFILAATGLDQVASMAAARCLLEDAKIARILPEAREVFEGRLAVVQIEVAPDLDNTDVTRPDARSSRRRSASRAAA